MLFIVLSFVAGLLTVLAPCVFPLLPVIIGGSSSSTKKWSPYIIISSLIISVIAFTLLLRATTALLFIDPQFWNYLSGGIIILLGLSLIFPDVWTNISTKIGFNTSSDKLLEKGEQGGFWGDIVTGVALGPVFTSCSPTYAYIIAIILPESFAFGIINLLAYSLGLGIVLLAVSLLGQRATKRLKWASNPYSLFKQIMGGLFILVGVAIIAGWLKILETWSAELLADTFIQWEIDLRNSLE
jgi:cytochrome c biogenesis protein CcdA